MSVTNIVWCCVVLLQIQAGASEFWVSAEGRPSGDGSEEDPWDLATAFSGNVALPEGATVWIRGGIYRSPDRTPNGSFPLLRHRGTVDRPIVFRAASRERVTIDGGLVVGSDDPAEAPAHVWLRDLEVTVSERNRRTEQTGSWPTDLGGPFGGVTMKASLGCRLINLVIHGNIGGGLNLWTPAVDAEVYGCIVAGNGWSAPDRGHGHGIYAQNHEGWKTVKHCLLTVPDDRGDQLAQFYGSEKAHLENFRVVDNIAYGGSRHTRFLLGGGSVARNHHVRGNVIHFATLQLGYAAKGNTGGELYGNVVSRGTLRLMHYQDCRVRGNLIVGDTIQASECHASIDLSDNVTQRTPAEFPTTPKVIVHANEYDPTRAHLAIFNWAGAKAAKVSVEGTLEPGDLYRLYDPTDVFGEAKFTGVCEGSSIDLPLDREFTAYLLIRETAAPEAVPGSR